MPRPDPPSKPDGDDVLSSLPSTRPQRRSSKRTDAPPADPKRAQAGGAPSASSRESQPPKRATAKPTAARAGDPQRSKPDAVRPSAATRNARSAAEPPRRPANQPAGIELVGTAVAAAGELAHLGLSLGARALRKVAARVPRP